MARRRAATLDLPRIVPIRGGATFSGSDWIGVRMTEASVLEGHRPRAAVRRLCRPRGLPRAPRPSPPARRHLVPRRAVAHPLRLAAEPLERAVRQPRDQHPVGVDRGGEGDRVPLRAA